MNLKKAKEAACKYYKIDIDLADCELDFVQKKEDLLKKTYDEYASLNDVYKYPVFFSFGKVMIRCGERTFVLNSEGGIDYRYVKYVAA